MEITPLAIDHASNRVRGIWIETRARGVPPAEPEGFYTWLRRMAEEALKSHDIHGKAWFRYRGMRFQIFGDFRGAQPMLHDVERIK